MFHKDLYGLRLKRLRKEAGETQAELAALLGVKPNQVVEMENGRKTTTFEKLVLICQHYQVSADYLLGLIDEPRAL
ncbi:helix-turn-helix transcriptional regulator [Pseudoflavonifractor phocaeensis]|uniref:helix-turn-helix domain-containing protein n=1 Tax=Pseudoflavonifractor phocaeensis TaxID=1870988 RepID=UPI0025A3FE8E|nr:helix-turn-helix transcriptional regulator [Pseudoflavonifractor phocaeensis]MDM8238060.1 helix-turn-helix transcriptional regulator [Pseudoflavonifractor phocaeensis]